MPSLPLLAVGLAFILQGCLAGKLDPPPTPGQKCLLNSDQLASLIGPAGILPIPVHVDSRFTKLQRKVLDGSMEQWNAFARHSLGVPLFEVREDEKGLGRFGEDLYYCDEKIQKDAPDGLVILAEPSSSHWREVLRKDAIRVGTDPSMHDSGDRRTGGITIRCRMGHPPRDGKPGEHARILVAVLTEDGDTVRMHSIFLHELGHAIGLGHSCRPGDGNKFYRGCNGLGFHHPYRQAIMFPSIAGPQSVESAMSLAHYKDHKESLRSNDMERAYCLYRGRP